MRKGALVLSRAGERCDPTTSEAFAAALGVDVLDNYWQTETGWPICGPKEKRNACGSFPGVSFSFRLVPSL